MATIYSNRNDGVGYEVYVNPNASSTWAGGVVPTSSDQVYVVGRRTTWNSGSVYKWTGTRTCTVASTTGFATSGYFYTVTTDGQILKIDYSGTTSTTFTNCTVDDTFDLLYDNGWDTTRNNGYIANGYYVLNPSYILEIKAGQNFTCNDMIIQEGGYVLIHQGGTLTLNQGLVVRDGWLLGRGEGTIVIQRPSSALSSGTIGYFSCENYYMSVVDIEGGENRTYATVAAPVTAGDVSITVSDIQNGTFAWGDDIALYNHRERRFRNKEYTGYRDATANFGEDSDEGLDVVGINGNELFVALRNGARGDIKARQRIGNQEAIDVYCDNVYFNAGDIVVINNTKYTIDKVEDSEFQIKNYDFTDQNTDLSEFWVNDPNHIYSGGWSIDAYGLTNTGGYSELVHKYIWERDIIVEAELSPLNNWDTGTRGTADFGILTSYDPAYRKGHRGYDSFKTDYFRVDDAADTISFIQRWVSSYTTNRLSRDNTLRTSLRGPATYRVDCRKAMATVYINGKEFNKEFYRNGNPKGLVGIFNDGNVQMHCRRLTISYPTQRLFITTVDNIAINQRVWRSGIERWKAAGARVVKLASINTGNGNHTDLCFAYRGQYGNGEWPLLMGYNSNSNTWSSAPYIHNHDCNVDYYLDLGAGANKYVVFDLDATQTFTHVSFQPRTYDESGNGGFNGYRGVAVYGSNDGTNWTTLRAATDDTKKWYYRSYNRMGFYDLGGSHTYRYIKFETDGSQASTNYNRYVNVGVHDFSDGYKLEVNNASDFNIGDRITVLPDSGYSWGSHDYEQYYAQITGQTNEEDYFQGGWSMSCLVTNKVGNMLYLDRPVFWGYIEGRDSVTVVKINRPFTITGTIPANGGTTTDWRKPNITTSGGSNVGRKYYFGGVFFDKMGSYRYAGSTSFNRGITIYSYDYWNAAVISGCTVHGSSDSNTWSGVGVQYGHAVIRNNVMMGMVSGVWTYYANSYTGTAVWNNKMLGCLYGGYLEGPKAFDFSYNEIATCENGIYAGSFRVNRMTIPRFSAVKRNTVKGTSNIGMRIYADQPGSISYSYIDIESNRVRATDDYSHQGWAVSSPYKDADALAEHTGSRMSRYRNEGHFAVGDTSTDLQTNMLLKNYGRYGMDIASTLYHVHVKDYNKPGIVTLYDGQGDSGYAKFGVEIDCLEAVDFAIDVYFDYKYCWQARLADDGTDDGRLRLLQLQRGTQIGIQYGAVPSTLTEDWATFSYTFTFPADRGPAAVYLARSAQSSYVDFTNSYAVVRCDQPEKLIVRANTFNHSRIFNPYRENDGDIRPLSSTRSIKINKLKF